MARSAGEGGYGEFGEGDNVSKQQYGNIVQRERRVAAEHNERGGHSGGRRKAAH